MQLEAALEKLFAFQLLERDKERILSDKNGSTMVHITKTELKNALNPTFLRVKAELAHREAQWQNRDEDEQDKALETYLISHHLSNIRYIFLLF